jgi:hypothetical protein
MDDKPTTIVALATTAVTQILQTANSMDTYTNLQKHQKKNCMVLVAIR